MSKGWWKDLNAYLSGDFFDQRARSWERSLCVCLKFNRDNWNVYLFGVHQTMQMYGKCVWYSALFGLVKCFFENLSWAGLMFTGYILSPTQEPKVKPCSNIEDDFAIEFWLNTIRSFPYFLCLDSAHFSWIEMIDLVLDTWMQNKNSKLPKPDGSIHGNLRIPPQEIAVHITGCISTMHQNLPYT